VVARAWTVGAGRGGKQEVQALDIGVPDGAWPEVPDLALLRTCRSEPLQGWNAG